MYPPELAGPHSQSGGVSPGSEVLGDHRGLVESFTGLRYALGSLADLALQLRPQQVDFGGAFEPSWLHADVLP